MKTIKYLLHYFFGKHQWELKARWHKDVNGEYVDVEYIFTCKKCGREKHIKITN